MKQRRRGILADEIRVCANEMCGREFHPRRWWQKYCKQECNQASYWQRKFASKPVDPFADLEVNDETLPQTETMEAEHQRRKEMRQELKDKASRLERERADKMLEELDKELDNLQRSNYIHQAYAPDPYQGVAYPKVAKEREDAAKAQQDQHNTAGASSIGRPSEAPTNASDTQEPTEETK
jgi:hypothetical protein